MMNAIGEWKIGSSSFVKFKNRTFYHDFLSQLKFFSIYHASHVFPFADYTLNRISDKFRTMATGTAALPVYVVYSISVFVYVIYILCFRLAGCLPPNRSYVHIEN